MALSGRFTNLGEVLERIDLVSEHSIDASTAAIWTSDVLFKMRGSIALKNIVTDGKNGNPQPIVISDYKGELPCDLVQPLQFFDAQSLRPLRESASPTHAMNFNTNTKFDEFKDYTPDMWVKGSTANRVPVGGLAINTSGGSGNNTISKTVSSGQAANQTGDLTYSLNQNYLFTGFQEGIVIAAYKGWPMDENGDIMIPADPPILNGIASYLQERIDYKLWRKGMIPDKVYTDSQQNRSWDVQAAVNHSVMPSLSQMESIKNIMTTMILKDNYFDTHFTSLGRNEGFKTHR